MIRSIWTSYKDVPNSMPASSGTNTRDFVSFFLFWFCSLPAIWFPVHQIRHLFTVKAYFVPVAGLTFFIWAIVRAKGIGPIVHQPSTKTGSALGWAIVQGIMSSIANFATLVSKFLSGSYPYLRVPEAWKELSTSAIEACFLAQSLNLKEKCSLQDLPRLSTTRISLVLPGNHVTRSGLNSSLSQWVSQ